MLQVILLQRTDFLSPFVQQASLKPEGTLAKKPCFLCVFGLVLTFQTACWPLAAKPLPFCIVAHQLTVIRRPVAEKAAPLPGVSIHSCAL